jgi:Leucine-rich repeat (LRR) protein
MKNLLYLLPFFVLLGCKKTEDIAEAVTINDPIFEKMLVTKGIDSDQQVNGKISKIDAMKVDTLLIQGDVSNITNTISNLAGIEEFENLTYLDCSYNSLSILDLSKNHKLTFVKCSGIQELIAGVTQYKQIQTIQLSPSPIFKTLIVPIPIFRI